MADELKLIEFGVGGRPVEHFDLERVVAGASGVIWKVKDSFKVTPGTPTNVDASGSRRWDGARTVAQKHGNAQVGARWRVSGSTAQEAIDNVGLFLGAVRHVQSGRYLKWRPEGVPYPTYFELRGPGEWTPDYSHVIFQHNYALYVDASWPVAPLAELDRMDVYDDFSVDSLGDWTYDAGLGLDAISGGALTAASAVTTARRSRHTVRGYRHTDGQATRRFTPGSTITGFNGGVHLCDDGAGNRIACYVDDDGANSRLRIDVVIAGATTNRASVNLGARIQNGVPLYVRGRREGGSVYAEHSITPFTPMGTPTTVAPAGGAGYVLTSVELAALPDGWFGTRWTPMHAAATIDEYEDLPFAYYNRLLPEAFRSLSVPGDDVPAKLNLHVAPLGGAASPAWALVAWWHRPNPHNLIWNGDFESSSDGWSVAAVSGVTGAASSITRVTAVAKAKYGVAGAEVVTPASANTGASFALYGRFRRGVTYTAELWVNSAAQTTLTRLRLGVSGDIASETAAALSATLTRRTVSWTPAADTSIAYVAFEVTAATATTMAIDAVMVYEGTLAPTTKEQSEGRGGFPPFGVIPAESGANLSGNGFTLITDANYRGGFGLSVPDLAGTPFATAEYVIDPSLAPPDDFMQEEIDAEVWARVQLSSTLVTPRLTVSLIPLTNILWGPQRFSAEYGSSGKLLTKPSAGSVFRIVRLGTLTMYSNRQQPQRQRLHLKAQWGPGSSGSFGIDQLYLVPIDARAVSGPTGQPLDAAYPRFANTTNGVHRIFRSDGSGLSIKPGEGPYPAPGLSRPLEVDAGDLNTLLLLSTLVPDDPTADASSEQEDHSASVHFALTPRVHFARGS